MDTLTRDVVITVLHDQHMSKFYETLLEEMGAERRNAAREVFMEIEGSIVEDRMRLRSKEDFKAVQDFLKVS